MVEGEEVVFLEAARSLLSFSTGLVVFLGRVPTVGQALARWLGRVLSLELVAFCWRKKRG